MVGASRVIRAPGGDLWRAGGICEDLHLVTQTITRIDPAGTVVHEVRAGVAGKTA